MVSCLIVTSFSDWRQLIHVGAIDCAEERNLAICVHYKIEGYPSVKVCPIHWYIFTHYPLILLFQNINE